MNLPKHMPALDGLRGAAILLVILTHVSLGWESAWSIVPGIYDGLGGMAIPSWLRRITDNAIFGVQLFFVVSAFTLTVQSVRRGSDLRLYALRRIARVGPGYWLAGLGYTVFAGLAPRLWAPHGVSFTDLVVAALFGSAWQGGASLAVVPGGWSVACEVSFYLALPVIFWLTRGRIWRAAGLTLVAVVVTQIRLRHAMADGAAAGFQFYVNPVEQAPVFLCGVTAALVAMNIRLPLRLPNRLLPAVSVTLVLTAILALPFQPIPRWHIQPHIVFAIVVAVAIAIAAKHPPWLLTNRAIRRIGELSYSMYLLHFALLAASLHLAALIAPALDWLTLLLHFAFTLAGSVFLATFTHRFIEQPAIAWASRRSGRISAPIVHAA